jgi:hypothetical protein
MVGCTGSEPNADNYQFLYLLDNQTICSQDGISTLGHDDAAIPEVAARQKDEVSQSETLVRIRR